MCDVFAIYDNNISPSLLMIILKIIILYFIQFQIRHTDNFPPTGTPASYDNVCNTFTDERTLATCIVLYIDQSKSMLQLGPDHRYRLPRITFEDHTYTVYARL